MKKKQLILILLFFVLNTPLFSQGWERTYGGSNLDIGYSVLQTANGDFISCGYTTSLGFGVFEAIYLVRTDIDGTTVWEKVHAVNNLNLYGQSLIATSDGNYLVAGYSINELNDDQDIYLLKVNPDGEMLWSSTVESPGIELGYQVIETQDNGFAVVGETRDSLTGQRDIFITKTDNNGNEEWNERIGDVLYDAAFSIIQRSNSNLLIAGYQTSIAPNDTTRSAVLIETNVNNGQTIDTYDLGEALLVAGAEIIHSSDGGYAVAIYNNTSVFLKKVNDLGVVEWEQEMPEDFSITLAASLINTVDGGYALTGSSLMTGQADSDAKVIKTDSNGNIEWQKTYGSPVDDERALSICNAHGKGFGVLGYTESFGAGARDYYLLMTDSLGFTLNNYIRGNIYYDFDNNCALNSGETGLHDWLLEAVGENATYYGLTNENGDFEIAVDTGEFILNLVLLNDYWQTCDNNIDLTLTGTFDTATVDFPLQALYDCPLLEVDISTPFLRRCFENQYTVTYCNDGTVAADDNVYIEVELDEFLIFDNSSITPSSINGNIYTFEIEDGIEVNECGTFTIDVTVDCDSTLLGQTHCVEAHIFPDSICSPVEQCWEGGSIELDASCEGDSVRFTIKNVGSATTTTSLNYIVIEDHVILSQEPVDDQGIPAGDSVVLMIPVDGQLLRLEVDQEPCHPGNSTPAISVEGCGQVDPVDISLGYLTEYYEDDSNPFVSIDCQENIGSWDPNDKRGFPKGYENQHLIEANTELDYIIRFQNTGSDTAFRVVIRDTISEWLDVRDIQVGASSHSYEYEIYRGNILKFTFNDILLPDSTTNEVASHGFVKFRIAQQLDNPNGTIIPNSAGIYFDYNPPVITNETWHQIGENYIDIVNTTNIFVPGIHVNYYPNPFTSETTFEITYDDGALIQDFETKTFNLFDTQGRLIRSETFEDNRFQFLRNGLTTGLYFFQIETKNKLIIGGKLIAH